ncbi:MAG: hypothetical protein RL616_1836 [Verrucomicrobiota bacterium]
MNLGKLLGAGKSFFGGHGSISYRAKKNIYLPKFNAGKNPFAPKAEAPAEPAVAEVKKISAPVAPRPARAANWTDKLNPFRAPQLVESPVAVEQVEFSLDAVKVLHNDLSDADVEIVPVKSRTITPAASQPNFLNEPVLRTA